MTNTKGDKIFIAIDLKSFYASVECVERGLDPLKAKLVVADVTRTTKTICLAVSPALKAYGIPGRARLFEVVQKAKVLKQDFFIAVPRMGTYTSYSDRIFRIYSNFVSPQDICAYSIDEVFIDITGYPGVRWENAHEFAGRMIKEVLNQTGITATCGIGTNIYLSKIAMDIVAKHANPDENGVRIAKLDEMTYRKLLWSHMPITDFWGIGPGTAAKLKKLNISTMGDIARSSLVNEDVLYNYFGVNAEILIDHAWGFESAEMKDIKSYVPEDSSLSSSQVLPCEYDFTKARLVLQEMTDSLVLDLVASRLVTDQLVIAVSTDRHGGIRGSVNLPEKSSSTELVMKAVLNLYDSIVPADLKTRRVSITANHLRTRSADDDFEQLGMLDGFSTEKERKMQETIVEIKKKYGKNSILRGMNFSEGATMRERNEQIGGHKA